MTDYDKLIQTMQEFCNPEAQELRLREKWTKAASIHALHIQLSDPAPDGDFEILFVSGEELDKIKTRLAQYDRVDEISFAAGVALAKEPNCCGGEFMIDEARIIAEVRNSQNYPAP